MSKVYLVVEVDSYNFTYPTGKCFASKEKAEEYADLKTRLAEEFTYDNDGYCEEKDAFMKELEQEALAWQEE